MIYSTYTWDLVPNPKFKLNISSFLTLPYPLGLPHLRQGYHDHCDVTLYYGGDGKVVGGSILLMISFGILSKSK